ncbi:hypothetical protein tb265_31710 [Gemmatimonadetes bacterium T265]|nr:hypothetical protein tb265_31710 [Gemmatimonadetes bacterium T265]
MPLGTIQHATADYEQWLARYTPVVAPDLARKHERMCESAFVFLRATYYRWASRWPVRCPELAARPPVPSVGDLHVENFGTWRDAEGRVAWGVNDFDEAWPLAWPQDLVRLAASAHLAAERGALATDPRDVASAVLGGYRDAVVAGGMPYVLAEQHPTLRAFWQAQRPDAGVFWARLDALPALAADDAVRPGARRTLARSLPAPDLAHRLVRRVAGLGSLGRTRLVAIAEWQGGRIAREVKAVAPSAAAWAAGCPPRAADVHIRETVERAVRCADPFYRARRRWLVRRLAPDMRRFDIAELPRRHDERHLLHAMGWETANVHLGGTTRRVLASELRAVERAHGPHWLADAAARMTGTVVADWTAWRAEPA